MFKDKISGLNQIFQSEIAHGGVIIVTGSAGSLKSAFVYNLLSEYLRVHKGEKGIYITLEENQESHLKNMKSIGIELEDRLQISDIASFRAHIGFEHMDYLDLIIKRINDTALNLNLRGPDNSEGKSSINKGKEKKQKTTCFALDSLNALHALIDLDRHKMRNKLLEFFTYLRKKNLTSFIVLEQSKESPYSEEFFLADGVIEFGITTSPEKSLKRYIQVKKMRSTKHSLDQFVIEVGKNGLNVVGKLLI